MTSTVNTRIAEVEQKMSDISGIVSTAVLNTAIG